MPRTDLTLAAYPSAVACVRRLVVCELPKWGLARMVSVVEPPAAELVGAVVRTIGAEAPAVLHHFPDAPVMRVWLRSFEDTVGLEVWDWTHLSVPVSQEMQGQRYPGTRWGCWRHTPSGGHGNFVELPITGGGR